MYKLSLLLFFISVLFAQNNNTKESNTELIEKQVKAQIDKEKEYAQSQSFVQGDNYDLKAVEVNQKSLANVPSIEPDYDFDMTDVYRDDI